MDWRWDFTFDVVLPRMWEAAGVTVWATVASFCIALVGGLILMLLKTHRSAVGQPPRDRIHRVHSGNAAAGPDLLSVLPAARFRHYPAAADHRYPGHRHL